MQKLCFSSAVSAQHELPLSKKVENVLVLPLYKGIKMMLHLLKTLFPSF